MQTFVSRGADARDVNRTYLRWNSDHSDGYVLNFGPLPGYSTVVLHSARCVYINGTPERGSDFVTAYGKACSNDRAELERWAEQVSPGRLTVCPCAG